MIHSNIIHQIPCETDFVCDTSIHFVVFLSQTHMGIYKKIPLCDKETTKTQKVLRHHNH